MPGKPIPRPSLKKQDPEAECLVLGIETILPLNENHDTSTLTASIWRPYDPQELRNIRSEREAI